MSKPDLEPTETHLRHSRQLKGFESYPTLFGNGKTSCLADGELQKKFRARCKHQGERRGVGERHKLFNITAAILKNKSSPCWQPSRSSPSSLSSQESWQVSWDFMSIYYPVQHCGQNTIISVACLLPLQLSQNNSTSCQENERKKNSSLLCSSLSFSNHRSKAKISAEH